MDVDACGLDSDAIVVGKWWMLIKPCRVQGVTLNTGCHK